MWFIVFAFLVLFPTTMIYFFSFGWIIPSIIVDVIVISLSIRIVTPNTVRLVELLWKFSRVLRPWFHLIIPVIEWTRSQDLFRKNFSVEVEWVTSDNVTAYIGLNVIYFVQNEDKAIFKSIYEIDDPKTMMRASIDEQLRWMIVHFNHKEIFWKREEIGEAIDEKLRVKLWQFGFTLDSIQVRDVKLDWSVMTAMNKVVESEKFKEATYNEADAKKILQVKEAEAEKESKILLWQWMAGQRTEIARWFTESIDEIKRADNKLTWEMILKFLLDSSRIETLGSIGAKSGTKLVYLNENLEGNTDKLIAGSDLMGK